MGQDAIRAFGILLLWTAAVSAQGTAPQPVVSEPSWQQPVVLLVGAIFTALGSWIAALIVKVLGKVAERAGHRLTVEQEDALHRWASFAVAAIEESYAAKNLRGAGERKFAEVLSSAQKKFPALHDEDLKKAILAAVNRLPGAGASGDTGK